MLKLETVPVLATAAGQVLIRVYAAAVNPVDWGKIILIVNAAEAGRR